jgi:hypothetical protein
MNIPESLYDFYKLKKCINTKQLYWNKLVLSKDAVPFIEKHIHILNKEVLKNLSKNPFAVTMLERHIDKISWNDFVNNPNAIHVVDKNIDLCFKELNWRGRADLIRHPNFIHIIEKHMDKIIDELLCSNCLSIIAYQQNPLFIDLLEKFMEKYPEKIPNSSSSNYFWNDLCENPSGIHIIEKNLDKLTNYSWQILAKNHKAIHIIEHYIHKLEDLGWRYLSENPSSIPLLEKHMDKINWYSLSANPNGIKIFEKYPEKIISYSFIDYENFSINYPIFDLDYDAIQKRCFVYKEELISTSLHPSRIEQYLEQGIPFEELDNYI